MLFFPCGGKPKFVSGAPENRFRNGGLGHRRIPFSPAR